jgi:hypothetical protein
MTRAALAYAQAPAQEPQERCVSVSLSPSDLSALTTAALAQAVLTFQAASQAEAAGRLDASSELLRLGCQLSRIEMVLRQTAR